MYQLVPSGDALWVSEQHRLPVGHTEPPTGWSRLRGRRLAQLECAEEAVTAEQTVAEGGRSAKRLAAVWVDNVIGNVHTSGGGDNIIYSKACATLWTNLCRGHSSFRVLPHPDGFLDLARPEPVRGEKVLFPPLEPMRR